MFGRSIIHSLLQIIYSQYKHSEFLEMYYHLMSDSSIQEDLLFIIILSFLSYSSLSYLHHNHDNTNHSFLYSFYLMKVNLFNQVKFNLSYSLLSNQITNIKKRYQYSILEEKEDSINGMKSSP